MTTEQETMNQKHLLFGDIEHAYALSHPYYPHDISYVKGNIHPDLFPTLLAYIQFQMKELQPDVTLFPQDMEKVLQNVYGFTIIEQTDDCEEVKVTAVMEEYKEFDYAILMLPFYRKGLLNELKEIVHSILDHFNRE